MSPAFEGSPQQYDVILQPNVPVAMRDGIRLATDIYRPALAGQPVPGPFPVLLERTPYDKASPVNAQTGRYFARRGYVCVLQDVRGRFASEGEWYPFAREAPDGYDTVAWLAAQAWCDGQVGTMGGSYCGSDQSALATLNPPHLSTMIVAVGASSYYHASMRQNGTLEQRFIVYAFRMATTSKEALADPGLRALLQEAYANVGEWFSRVPFKRGASALHLLPSYEQWVLDILTHDRFDAYWQQRGYAIAHYYDQHADVPTLYLGGWYDSYARATCENFMELTQRKQARQMLLMGPWTHGGWEETYAGDMDFGTDSLIHYNDLRLSWFDHELKGLPTALADCPPVRIFVMGHGHDRMNYEGRLHHGGIWRDERDFPLPDTAFTPFYLHGDGTLAQTVPAAHAAPSRYTFDPRDPVPTVGGGISAANPIMEPGAYDQRGHPDFFGSQDSLPLNARSDVLSFQTLPLEADLEVTGPIAVTLYVASSAPDTDFTAKLIEVFPPHPDYPGGLAMNLTDSILRARFRQGWTQPEWLEPDQMYALTFQLYPTSNLFKAGHRIRLDISSSNFPRFDVNPNTGGPLGRERQFRLAQQTIFHDADHPSHVMLPVISR